MQIVLTALIGACQSSILCRKMTDISSSRARKARKDRIYYGKKITLLNNILISLAITITLGTILASAEAAPLQPHPLSPFDPKAAVEHKAGSNDPLEAVDPVQPVEFLTYDKLLEQFVVSLAITNPPKVTGETSDQIDVRLTEYMEFEDMRVPVWIVDTILRASQVTGADPVYMMALADKESSFLPGNKASTSSAVGLFQFISSTWLEAVRSFGPKHGLIMEAQAIEGPQGTLSVNDPVKLAHILGLRRNPYVSALMAAEMMQRDKTKIEKRLGRKLSRSEFYLSHFFGVDSASRFIALVDDTPKKSAKSEFPAAARSNKSLFFAKDGKKTRQLSVSEVYGKIDDMIDKRLNRYEDVSSRATADAAF
jgi:hypothetical protein